jgi:hypothetical protein
VHQSGYGWVCTKAVMVGCTQWRLWLGVHNGGYGWVCAKAIMVGCAPRRLWLGVHKGDYGWVCTKEVMFGCAPRRLWLGVHQGGYGWVCTKAVMVGCAPRRLCLGVIHGPSGTYRLAKPATLSRSGQRGDSDNVPLWMEVTLKASGSQKMYYISDCQLTCCPWCKMTYSFFFKSRFTKHVLHIWNIKPILFNLLNNTICPYVATLAL